MKQALGVLTLLAALQFGFAQERPLEGEAFVHNGFGFYPRTSIYEAISFKPLLAFYRFKIA